MSGVYKSSSKPGTIVVVRGQGGEETPKQGIIQVEGESGQLTETEDIIIVAASMQQQVAYKTAPTIGGPEYLFVFGDRLSPLTINAILFQDSMCSEGAGSESNGVMSALKFYAKNRLTPGNAPLITVAYSGATFQGFLVGVSIDSQNQNGNQTHSASLQLIGWVDHESVGAANTEAPTAATPVDLTASPSRLTSLGSSASRPLGGVALGIPNPVVLGTRNIDLASPVNSYTGADRRYLTIQAGA